MKRSPQAILLVLSGTGLLHISLLTDLYLRYVKDWMRPTLIASGVLLLLLGVADAWSHRGPGPSRDEGEGERGAHEDHDGHRHDHSGAPRAAWLLLLPALSMLFYAPPSLGAYTASRQASKPIAVQQDDFEPLPALSPLPLTLGDFTSRVRQDPGQAVKGRSVQMTGFVTPVGRGEGWDLTRLLINCCSADAQAVKVRIYGGETPPADAWVTVVGTWHADGTLGTGSAAVALDARTVSEVDRPTDWYRDALPLPLPR
ncbi:TIGR03943 family protein [Streptomyces sp. NPDC088752]|uniref:TIGR03943 family putative permease subunit n=1 Tax=Streptomyces sp. NPDC088752 TaxID=3154963 RepID=UPI00341E9E63